MTTWRFYRSAAAGAVVSLFLFSCAANSQVHLENRPPLSAVAASSQPSVEEKFLLDAANRERAATGARPLLWDAALAVAARRHAEIVVNNTLLSHQYPGEAPLSERASRAGAKFSMVAENIAMGTNPETIHNGWMHSPGHRKNILNPELTSVGIVMMKGSGGLFAVQDFSRVVEILSLGQQEEQVVSLVKAAGVAEASATESARKTCAMEQGFVGERVSYIFHFESADLSQLPDGVVQKIKGGKYRVASVGACQSDARNGFTQYKIAVLLN